MAMWKRAFFLGLLLALVFAPCSETPLLSPACAAEQGAELYFTILHTNDEHSSLIPHSPAIDYHPELENKTVGGYARLATVVGRIRKEKAAAGEPVLLLSAGDFIGGSPYSWLVPAGHSPEISLIHQLGYDAATIGNHEFDYGSDNLVAYLRRAGYPEANEKTVLLASNMEVPAGHPAAGLFKEYQLLELENGLKVGLFGLIGRDAVSVAASPEPIKFADQHQTAKKMVSRLRGEGADVVVAITHAGVEEDRALARAVSGINVIVGGHCHTALSVPIQEEETIIVQAGSQLSHLGMLELAYDPRTERLRIRNRGSGGSGQPYLIPLDWECPLDPEVEALIAEHTEALNGLVGELTRGRFQDVMETVMISDFVIPTLPLQESPFGNFITDAMRLVAGAKLGKRVDVALQANGSIRGSITPGSLPGSRGHVPFYDLVELIGLGMGPEGTAGYPIVSFYVTGEELRRALEVAVLLPELYGDSFFLQFSGLRYQYNPANAILFTVPFINQPIPTTRAVTKAEIYTGEGVQGSDDKGYKLLKRGDQELYHVVTDLYIVSFLPMVGKILPHLEIVLKDADGNPVGEENLEKLIVYDQGRELKVWQAVVEYAAGQLLNEEGLPQASTYYEETSGRINPVQGVRYFTYLLLGLLLIGVAIVLLIIRRQIKKQHSIQV